MNRLTSGSFFCPLWGFKHEYGYLSGCSYQNTPTSLKISARNLKISHENIVGLFYFVKKYYYSNINYVYIVNNYYRINILLIIKINELLNQRKVEVEAEFTLVPNVKTFSNIWRVNSATSAETMRYRVYRVISGSSPLTDKTIEIEPILARPCLSSSLVVCFFLLPLSLSGRETVLLDVTNADKPSNKKKAPPCFFEIGFWRSLYIWNFNHRFLFVATSKKHCKEKNNSPNFQMKKVYTYE